MTMNLSHRDEFAPSGLMAMDKMPKDDFDITECIKKPWKCIHLGTKDKSSDKTKPSKSSLEKRFESLMGRAPMKVTVEVPDTTQPVYTALRGLEGMKKKRTEMEQLRFTFTSMLEDLESPKTTGAIDLGTHGSAVQERNLEKRFFDPINAILIPFFIGLSAGPIFGIFSRIKKHQENHSRSIPSEESATDTNEKEHHHPINTRDESNESDSGTSTHPKQSPRDHSIVRLTDMLGNPLPADPEVHTRDTSAAHAANAINAINAINAVNTVLTSQESMDDAASIARNGISMCNHTIALLDRQIKTLISLRAQEASMPLEARRIDFTQTQTPPQIGGGSPHPFVIAAYTVLILCGPVAFICFLLAKIYIAKAARKPAEKMYGLMNGVVKGVQDGAKGFTGKWWAQEPVAAEGWGKDVEVYADFPGDEKV